MKEIIATVRNVPSNLKGNFGRIVSKELHEFAGQKVKILVEPYEDTK